MNYMLPFAAPRNRLAYPAGRRPGFDPTHPASTGIYKGGGSFTSVNNNFVNLLNGQACVLSATLPTPAILGGIGPCLEFNANSVCCEATNLATAGSVWTLGAVIQLITYTTGSHYVCTNSGLGQSIRAGSGVPGWVWNNSAGLGVAPVVSVPYFLAASAASTGTAYMVQCNLKTGAILIGSGTANSLSGNGAMFIGNNALAGTDPFLGYIAAIMFGSVSLGLQQLIAWASDPWAFWYPRSKFVGGF